MKSTIQQPLKQKWNAAILNKSRKTQQVKSGLYKHH